jgi:hypothetical protein
MSKMQPAPNAAPRPAQNPFLHFAVALTLAAIALHIYFLNRVGGLWRDENNSVNLAQQSWANVTHDAFPILFPALLRTWCALGLGHSDFRLRIFGGLIGAGLIAACWIAARWLRGQPPLWTLVLAALNGWVIYYGDGLRAYGLGAAMILLTFAAGVRFFREARLQTWWPLALLATLSVQSLYQNCALVAAVCAGGCAVAAMRKNFRLAAGFMLAGAVAAISLLPYYRTVAGMDEGAAPLRMDFDFVIARNALDTLIAFPLPQYADVWLILVAAVGWFAVSNLFSERRNETALFAAVTLTSGTILFVLFLWRASFPVQPWYFLPLLTLATAALESSLPHPSGKWRAVAWGGIAATAAIAILFNVRLLDAHYTNVNLQAAKIKKSLAPKDFTVVTLWEGGITFARYFSGAGEWTTLPPMADHATHRYDLLKQQMKNPDALKPVLASAEKTLRAGGTVWIVGGLAENHDAQPPASPPPPPLPRTGWHETPYRIIWNSQFGWFICHHATNIVCVDAAHGLEVDENYPLWKASGWTNAP